MPQSLRQSCLHLPRRRRSECLQYPPHRHCQCNGRRRCHTNPHDMGPRRFHRQSREQHRCLRRCCRRRCPLHRRRPFRPTSRQPALCFARTGAPTGCARRVSRWSANGIDAMAAERASRLRPRLRLRRHQNQLRHRPLELHLARHGRRSRRRLQPGRVSSGSKRRPLAWTSPAVQLSARAAF